MTGEKQEGKWSVMKEIRLEKVTLNMGMGEAGPKLEKGRKIMNTITGRKVVITKAKRRSSFGVPKGKDIGVKVTLRGKAAMEFLEKAFKARDNWIKPRCFDSSGNFSFGIHEYINIPGVRYDPEVGIIGMDVAVTLERPGFRIKKRMIRPKKVGKAHRITREEAMEWARKQGVEVREAEE
jgi:large subunit ribosomal protein L5